MYHTPPKYFLSAISLKILRFWHISSGFFLSPALAVSIITLKCSSISWKRLPAIEWLRRNSEKEALRERWNCIKIETGHHWPSYTWRHHPLLFRARLNLLARGGAGTVGRDLQWAFHPSHSFQLSAIFCRRAKNSVSRLQIARLLGFDGNQKIPIWQAWPHKTSIICPLCSTYSLPLSISNSSHFYPLRKFIVRRVYAIIRKVFNWLFLKSTIVRGKSLLELLINKVLKWRKQGLVGRNS